MNEIPFKIGYVGVPPIKCQGIKTKLVPFIFSSVKWNAGGSGRWIEPFLGSGVVAFNLCPDRALLSDTNRHIIGLYQMIQRGEMNKTTVRAFLTKEGKNLSAGGGDYYYEVRERFNKDASPYDFLFLNRSCFNGVMRFNRRGEFNVPFGHKCERFSQSYVTKIANQIDWVAKQMRGKEWEFRVARWDEAFGSALSSDFIYLDPPYIGRHTDYYNTWDDTEATRLACAAQQLPCGFALSMWLENRYRSNPHIEQHWSGLDIRVCSHFYHVGSSENLRNEIDEALILKQGFATADNGKQHTKRPAAKLQLSLVLEM